MLFTIHKRGNWKFNFRLKVKATERSTNVDKRVDEIYDRNLSTDCEWWRCACVCVCWCRHIHIRLREFVAFSNWNSYEWTPELVRSFYDVDFIGCEKYTKTKTAMAFERTTNKSKCIFGFTSLTWRGDLHQLGVCVCELFSFRSLSISRITGNGAMYVVCILKRFFSFFWCEARSRSLSSAKRIEERKKKKKKTIRAKRLRFVSLLLLSVHTPHSHTASSLFDSRILAVAKESIEFQTTFRFRFFAFCVVFFVFFFFFFGICATKYGKI